jgi:hypothetical protein
LQRAAEIEIVFQDQQVHAEILLDARTGADGRLGQTERASQKTLPRNATIGEQRRPATKAIPRHIWQVDGLLWA